MTKPFITEEARVRLSQFVAAVQLAQENYGVLLCADDDSIVLRDARRAAPFLDRDPKTGRDLLYGEWDASLNFTAVAPHSDVCGELPEWEPCICGALSRGVRAEDLEFEDFDGWNK